jgi:hypothetical protein
MNPAQRLLLIPLLADEPVIAPPTSGTAHLSQTENAQQTFKRAPLTGEEVVGTTEGADSVDPEDPREALRPIHDSLPAVSGW